MQTLILEIDFLFLIFAKNCKINPRLFMHFIFYIRNTSLFLSALLYLCKRIYETNLEAFCVVISTQIFLKFMSFSRIDGVV